MEFIIYLLSTYFWSFMVLFIVCCLYYLAVIHPFLIFIQNKSLGKGFGRDYKKERGYSIMGHIHIYAPIQTAKSVTTEICPDCKKRTRMISVFTPWYGWDSTCIRCGRSWADGEWMPLDFVRQSRQKSIANAKRRWRALPPVSNNHYGI